MVKEEFEDLKACRSYVRVKNSYDQDRTARVIAIFEDGNLVLQLPSGREVTKHYTDVRYVGTPGIDCPYLTDYL